VAGPDLSGAAGIVEGLMDDLCVVYPPFDPGAVAMDPATLRIEELAAAPVYGTALEPAPFKLKPIGGPGYPVVAGEPTSETSYRVDLPLSAPLLVAGSLVLVAYSRRMPQAVGLVLAVTAPVVKTFAVQASYAAELRIRTEGD
jgi:hypothetical protein